MRRLVMAVTIAAAALTMSRAATAQELGGYVQAGGGFASATDGTSGDVSAQIGVRASRYVIAFVDVGQVRNLQPSVVQSAIDAAVANLAATNVNVTGSGRGAAFYTVGGVKLLVPTHSVVTPYATAGLGVGHLTPSATFTYNTGSTISGGTATAGQDATTDITTTPVNAMHTKGGIQGRA